MGSSIRPQLEHGYTKIADKLLEAIIRFDFSKRHQKIIFAVIRKTYGFGKTRDDIVLDHLVEMTGISRANVSRTVADLATRNVLLRSDGKFGYVLELNKNYWDWV